MTTPEPPVDPTSDPTLPAYPAQGYEAPGYGPPGYGPNYGPAGYGAPQQGPPIHGPTAYVPGYGTSGYSVSAFGALPVSPGGYRLADFSDRVTAWFLDGIILGAAAGIVLLPVLIAFIAVIQRNYPDLSRPGLTPDQVPTGFVGAVFLLVLGAFVAFLVMRYIYSVELARSGQTIGKRVAKIQIIPVDPRRTLTRGMLAKRFLVESVAGSFVPFVAPLDGLWQLWDQPYRQCLHDKAAETLVIKLVA